MFTLRVEDEGYAPTGKEIVSLVLHKILPVFSSRARIELSVKKVGSKKSAHARSGQ